MLVLYHAIAVRPAVFLSVEFPRCSFDNVVFSRNIIHVVLVRGITKLRRASNIDPYPAVLRVIDEDIKTETIYLIKQHKDALPAILDSIEYLSPSN